MAAAMTSRRRRDPGTSGSFKAAGTLARRSPARRRGYDAGMDRAERRRLGWEGLARLAPAPRRVPFSLRVRMLFGGFGVMAWIWFGFGSSLATVFLRKADLFSWAQFRGSVASLA